MILPAQLEIIPSGLHVLDKILLSLVVVNSLHVISHIESPGLSLMLVETMCVNL